MIRWIDNIMLLEQPRGAEWRDLLVLAVRERREDIV